MVPNTSKEGAQPGNSAPRLNPVLTPEQAQDELVHLYRLFGPQAVFILINYGKKAAAEEFAYLTPKLAQKPERRKALLEAIRIGGNIALVLGKVSGGIRAIDLDRPDQLERFLMINSLFASRVQSRSAHGGQFFFRMDEGAGLPNGQSFYPFYLEDEKEPIGELRLGPNVYSVVYGWLDPVESGDKAKGILGPPEGVRYELFGETLGAPEWKDVQWPYNYRLPWNEKSDGAPQPGSPPEPPLEVDDPNERVDPDDQADQVGGVAPKDKKLVRLAELPLDERQFHKKRIWAYLDKVDVAVDGKGGSATSYRVACSLTWRWALCEEDATRFMRYYNDTRCRGPWEERDIERMIGRALAETRNQHPFGDLFYGSPFAPDQAAQANQDGVAGWKAANGFIDLISLAQEVDQPELDLLGDGFLRRGGGMTLIGPTESGKSSLSMQLSVEWACGFERGIIKSRGPLRVIVIQAEDDRQDSREMARVYQRLGLSTEQIELVKKNTRFVEWCPKGFEWALNDQGEMEQKPIESGRELTRFLEEEIERSGPVDLVIVNPLSAYMDEGVMSQKANRNFFYGWITPFLKRHSCGIVFVHHTPKFKDDDGKEPMRHVQLYAGAGDATITNWPRASLFIRPSGKEGLFKLVAGKRAKRIGWDEPERFFRWSEGFILWREANQAEVEEHKTARKTRKSERSISAHDLYKVYSGFHGEWVLRADLIEALVAAGFTDTAAGRTIHPMDGYQRKNLAYEGRGRKLRIKWIGIDLP